MGDYWEATSEMYSSFIQKPKMTQKLLSKPPFRYIFDIFFETSKKTNFAQGLFIGNELSGDYYNDKDKKLLFLQKLIKLIQAMQGSQVKAKPPKIVAGLQPQATNLMLQSMFKVATGGQSSDPFVAKILGGGAPVQQPPKKQQQAKKPQPKQEKKKIERPPSARNQKKIQQQPPSKKQVETHQQPQTQQPEVTKPQKKATGKQEYSQKVKQMMNEGEEEVQAQKEAQVQERESKKDINMGRLRKKPNQDKQKVANTGGDLSDKQLDLVKAMVQSICQNIGPLGKSVEFINDDIESMNKQLIYWRKQYNASKAKYQSQLKVTEQALMPIYDKLAQIQDQIKDQKGKIQTAKSQIIKNDSTIRDLLMSVVTTK